MFPHYIYELHTAILTLNVMNLSMKLLTSQKTLYVGLLASYVMTFDKLLKTEK